MPFIPLIFVLIGSGGAFFGVDQHKKRKKEQAAFRASIDELERQLTDLKSRLGEKNEQVRTLAALIQQMRQENCKSA